MKKIIIFIFFVFFIFFNSFSQKVDNLNYGLKDSSLYCHIKLNTNKYWIAGKHGYLIEIDTTNKFKRIHVPYIGLNILKMGFINSKILMATHKGSFIIFDTLTKLWSIKIYKELKNKCIYDFDVENNHKITIIGGHTNLSMGKKEIPNGYIAYIDENLNFVKFGLKKKFRMFWAIATNEKENKYFVGYNGLNSKIYYYPKMNLITKSEIIKLKKKKLMIYDIECTKKIIYYGSQKFNLKTGIIHFNDSIFKIKGGIIWTSYQLNDSTTLFLDNSKNAIFLNSKNSKLSITKTTIAEVPYGVFEIRKNNFLVYGRDGLISFVYFYEKK